MIFSRLNDCELKSTFWSLQTCITLLLDAFYLETLHALTQSLEVTYNEMHRLEIQESLAGSRIWYDAAS